MRRRGFLAFLLSSVALPAVGQSDATITVPSGTCDTARPRLNPPAMSFIGADRVLLQIEETELVESEPQPVSIGAPVRWSPNPHDRLGGQGQLGDVEGNFSGRRHATAAQLFRPWAGVKRHPVSPLFDPADVEQDPKAAADRAESWFVNINGVVAAVLSVSRKTLPIGSVQIAPREFASSRRSLVTLVLDRPIPEGAIVSVAAAGLVPVVAIRSAELHSEVIHVCQAGYPLAGTKKAYVGLWLGQDEAGRDQSTDALLAQGQVWRLIDAETGTAVANGVLRLAKATDEPHMDEHNFNGCDVYEADFSAVSEPGTYRLEVSGIGRSFAFPIAENPYAEVFRLAARWYYHQRSGCAITEPYGEGRLRPQNGHPEDGLTVWQTTVKLGRTSEGFADEPGSTDVLRQQPAEGTIGAVANPRAWGGWHDAGDWDRRIQHMEVVWQMALMVELFAAARELDMNIPESGRAFADPAVNSRKAATDRGDGFTVLPDLIHEALWGISLWRRTQTPEGGIIGGVEYSLDGITGSVSWNPLQLTYAYAPEEWCAYLFVMAAAKLGHVIATVCGDEVLGAALISEAEAAWAWAEAEVAAGSTSDSEEAAEEVAIARLKAAASLYRANGDPVAREVFEATNPFLARARDTAPNASRAILGSNAFDYVRAGSEGREVDPEITSAIINWSGGRLSRDDRIGSDYGLHSTDLVPWGVGWHRFGPGSNWRAGLALLHYMATNGETELVTDVVLEGLWFGLGCNPSNTSFIQGVGTRIFADPFSADLRGLCRVPGQICFGVAAGQLRWYERDRIVEALYPEEDAWPRYARIFETSRVLLCAEHGIKSNALEWLSAVGFSAELLAIRCSRNAARCQPA